MQGLTYSKYEFEGFELDLPKRQLRREGEVVALNPKAFDLLQVLVENSGKLLTKDDLFEMVWGDQIVEESNLTVNMSAIRRALGERASEPRFIMTVSGQGYRFVGDVRQRSDGPMQEVVVESHSVSRIVVAEEDEKELSVVQENVPALPASAATSSKNDILMVAGLVVLAVVAVGIGIFLWQGSGRKTESSFQVAGMKRLTDIGNVNNAALSPDGKLFIYATVEKDGRRTLWQGHVDGSRNIELLPTSDVVYLGLAFSPDGGSIFYNVSSKDFPRGAVFKMKVFGGVPEKICENVPERFTFAPDGNRLAFVRDDPEQKRSSLIVYDIAAAAEREIASRPIESRYISGTPAWSPSGKEIAAAAITKESEGTREIFLISTSDGAARQISNQSWQGTRAIAWSRDESDLYLVASDKDSIWESQLWKMSTSGGAAQRIITDLNVYGGMLNVSADNKNLLLLQTQHYSNIYVAPATDLNAAKQITFDLLGKKSGWSGLNWTADGRIIYTAFVDTSETIWTMDSDGQHQKQIIPEGRSNNYFGLSGDGKKMVFDSNRSGSLEIWIANGDGTGMRQLTSGGSNSQADIAPDGSWVVYRSTQAGVTGLQRISLDGGAPVQLISTPANWPRFSPDGKMIACTMTLEGKLQLALINSADGQIVRSFDVPQTANFNNGLRWTPSGDAVTYRDWNNGIWRQPITGGDAARLPGLPEEKLYSYGWSRDGKQFAYTRGTEIRDLVLIQNSN